MSIVRMHEYIMAAGGVPESVQQVVELDQQTGHKFVSRDSFDPSVAKFWLGLDGNCQRKLPDVERLRLANLLRRAGEISDEELEGSDMIARPIVDMLATVQKNRMANRGVQLSNGYSSS